MDYYRTKGDLLEAQGKDRSDTRWVDRQIAKGLISRDEDGFYLNCEKRRFSYPS